ncbi:RecX family transcriptional regulator [Microvirga aerilata]|uniref:RecX family transcriptional regulator n=1 Tax=Microvirga aerilata TaxID=670292 RepID=UPI0036335772
MTDPRDRPERKPPRKVSPAYLQRAAMSYLERYSSSAENLRRVLRRKVDKRCRLRGEDPAEFHELIDEVVAKSLRVGLIDDSRYAEARVATLRRRGGSARAIQAKLSAKGWTAPPSRRLWREKRATKSRPPAPLPAAASSGRSGPASARPIATRTWPPWPAPASGSTWRGR